MFNPEEISFGLPSTEKKLSAKRSMYAASICKKPWTAEEDARLRECVLELGTARWSAIAAQMPERSGKQCRERWHNHLTPQINKGAWTEEEDRIIITMQEQLGNQWAKITRMLPGRSDNAVKNRFHMAMRARNRELKEQLGQGHLVSIAKPAADRRASVGSPILLPTPDIYGSKIVPCFQSFPSPPPVCSPSVENEDQDEENGGDHPELLLARIDPVTNIPYADVEVYAHNVPVYPHYPIQALPTVQPDSSYPSYAAYPQQSFGSYPEARMLEPVNHYNSHSMIIPSPDPSAMEFGDDLDNFNVPDAYDFHSSDGQHLDISIVPLNEDEVFAEWMQEEFPEGNEDADGCDLSCGFESVAAASSQCMASSLRWYGQHTGQQNMHQDEYMDQDEVEIKPSAMCGLNFWNHGMQQPQQSQHQPNLIAPAPKKAGWRLRW